MKGHVLASVLLQKSHAQFHRVLLKWFLEEQCPYAGEQRCIAACDLKLGVLQHMRCEFMAVPKTFLIEIICDILQTFLNLA